MPRTLLALLAALLLAPALVRADPAPNWLTRTTLTGDWDGARTALTDQGVTVSASWVGELLGNVSGGMRQGGVYDGLLTLGADLDLEKLAGWQGGLLHASVYWIQGEGLSENYIGNLLTVSSIEAPAGVRLNELYLEQSFADDLLSLRIGQIAADTEFWQSATASLFINSSFGWPGINAADLPGGGPAYPSPTPGLRLRWSPSDAFSLQAGVYNGDPLGKDGNADGLDFPLDDGLFAIVEASWTGKDPHGLAATYRLGGWYNSQGFADLATAADGLSLADLAASGGPLVHDGDYALYAIVDRQLWSGGAASLSGFVRVAVAPEQDRNPIGVYLDTGLALTGPLTGRPNGIAGIGFAYARMSPALAAYDRASNGFTGVDGPVQDDEAVVEVTYQAAVTPWLSVQPFVQYVLHPGGNIPQPDGRDPSQALRDAAVFGVRSSVTF